jgi:hypothetical protein
VKVFAAFTGFYVPFDCNLGVNFHLLALEEDDDEEFAPTLQKLLDWPV